MTNHQESPSQPRATVVIINYNGLPFLDELFSGLRAQAGAPAEILFLDNGSSDGSPERVAEGYPWVRVHRIGSNTGFAAAANLGIRLASAPYVVLLNTDIRTEADWLAELIKAADRHPRAAAIASKMMLHDRPRVLNGVGGSMNSLGYTWDRGMFEEDCGQYDDPAQVLFAPAAAALFRKSAWLEAGGCDETFFMYHEDVDLCWRFWILGFEVITAPKAVVYHHFGGTTRESRGFLWREILGERNNIRSLLKNYSLSRLVSVLPSLLLLPQRPRRKLKQVENLAWNLLKIADTLGHRRKIQRARKRSDQDLDFLIERRKDVPIRL